MDGGAIGEGIWLIPRRSERAIALERDAEAARTRALAVLLKHNVACCTLSHWNAEPKMHAAPALPHEAYNIQRNRALHCGIQRLTPLRAAWPMPQAEARARKSHG